MTAEAMLSAREREGPRSERLETRAEVAIVGHASADRKAAALDAGSAFWRDLSTLLVTRIFAAAMSRANVARDRRRPFALYIDEFQNFTTDAVGTMVSQARKHGLSLVLAHQNLSQLQDSLGQEVLGNVGNMICFRPGAPDAEKLQKYFEPVGSGEAS